MKKLGSMGLALASILSLGTACGGGGSSSDAAPGGDSGDGCYTQDTTGFDCGTNGGDDCVVYPSTGIMAVADDDTLVPADFSCAPETPATAAATIAVTGVVENFQDGAALANATVSVFDDFDFAGAPLATATSAASGDYSLTLPVGTPNRTHWLMEHDDALDTIALSVPIDVTQPTATNQTRGSVSTLTANALPAFIGHARTPGLAVVAGTIRDCQGRRITGAIGVVSSTSSAATGANTSSTPIEGGEIYFFGDGGLPTRRNMRNETNLDGQFVAIELPTAAMVYLQGWGYLTAEDACTGPTALTLLSEVASPALADTVISASLYPTEGPL